MPNEILLGVSGGIACFKAAALCSKLAQNGFGVSVIMTESSRQFIGAATFEALSGRKVCHNIFDPAYPLGAHIELARKADLFLIAPATANLIGKVANGIADDLLTTTVLSFTKQIYFAPAMNVEMWGKTSVQRNVDRLRKDGLEMIGPDSGWQSCREQGSGRMSEPDAIFDVISEALKT